jgi:hypothetical protein
MRPLRTILLLSLTLVATTGLAAAATSRGNQVSPALATDPAELESLRLHAFTLRHQPASEAMAVIVPLLSRRGTVELQPATNTLLVRDTLSAVTRVAAAVQAFDHPARPIRLELQLVEASQVGAGSGRIHAPSLAPDVTTRLRKLFPYYGTYAPVAGADFDSFEGEEVVYDLAGRFRIAFRLGTLADGKRLRVSSFRIWRLPEDGEGDLLHTNLSLPLGQTMILALAREEAAPRSLMVVLEANLGTPPLPVVSP